MDGENNNDPANAMPQDGALRRRPGRPKGLPRPPGAGRKKGTPNKSTAEIRGVAQKHGAKAIAKAVRLLESKDERVALAALREILDRAYGRPTETRELTGKDGAPLNPPAEMSDLEAAQSICFVLAKAAHQKQSDEDAAAREAAKVDGMDVTPEPRRFHRPRAAAAGYVIDATPVEPFSGGQDVDQWAARNRHEAALQRIEEAGQPDQRVDWRPTPKVITRRGG